ncbi:MAG: OB-fold nucleic acid binding domain-containing protein [Candidatus Aenigmarchaeota archaeon]|nr:OB-fold nucleic acid binding domain-containing protein [Candidatus Aenigmarchaeota archaeon]
MDSDIIIHKIIEKTGSSYENVQRMILNKQQELSNLVSKDGAAYIVAKEMGLDLFERSQHRLEVKNVIAGIKNLNLNARIYKIIPVKEFEHKGRKSQVANLILSDQTGRIRMSLWDTQIKLLDNLKEGQAVEIFGAYTRDNNGIPEVRLSRKGGIKILESSDIPIESPKPELTGKYITDLKEGDSCEIRAAIVQLFETAVFYEMCPTCKTKLNKENGAFVCKTHGPMTPEYLVILNCVLDDGTDNVRAVFFRDNALKIMGMPLEEALGNRGNIFESLDILGKEFTVTGTLRKNKLFNKLEFVVSDVKDVDVKTEANKIIGKLKHSA